MNYEKFMKHLDNLVGIIAILVLAFVVSISVLGGFAFFIASIDLVDAKGVAIIGIVSVTLFIINLPVLFGKRRGDFYMMVIYMVLVVVVPLIFQHAVGNYYPFVDPNAVNEGFSFMNMMRIMEVNLFAIIAIMLFSLGVSLSVPLSDRSKISLSDLKAVFFMSNFSILLAGALLFGGVISDVGMRVMVLIILCDQIIATLLVVHEVYEKDLGFQKLMLFAVYLLIIVISGLTLDIKSAVLAYVLMLSIHTFYMVMMDFVNDIKAEYSDSQASVT